MVRVEYDRREVVTSRSGDNNFLSACCEVSGSLLFGRVEARALEDNINIMLSPRNVFCIALSIDLDRLALDRDRASFVISRNRVSILVSALGRIVLQQVCEHGRLREVVDSDDFITLSVEHLTECETTDTAKTIDSNFYCHLKITP